MTSHKEVKKVKLTRKHFLLLLVINVCSISSQLLPSPSFGMEKLLKEVEEIFQDPPKGIPPLRGIEHQIDILPESSFPNRSANRRKPKEEIHRVVKRLSDKE